MLGVVTRVGLEVERRFNLDVQTDFMSDDVLWKKGVETLVGDCDWGQLVWLPRAGKVMRMCGTHTLQEAEPGANNSLLAPHVEAGAMAAFKELMEDTIANGAYLCTIESERWSQLKSYPPFVKDCCCKKRYDAHVVGPADLMMSSELTEHQEQLSEVDYEIAVPLSEAKAALQRVRDYAKDKRLCMPLIGAFLRFSPVEEHTLIGHSVERRGRVQGAEGDVPRVRRLCAAYARGQARRVEAETILRGLPRAGAAAREVSPWAAALGEERHGGLQSRRTTTTRRIARACISSIVLCASTIRIIGLETHSPPRSG